MFRRFLLHKAIGDKGLLLILPKPPLFPRLLLGTFVGNVFYRIHPDPRTLVVIQNIMFWWIIPAAYTLARSESRSEAIAVSAAALVPFAPLLWPLVWNDFRELQLALPFVLWAVQGIRGRRVGLAAVGVLGMLACRQEFAVMAGAIAPVPRISTKSGPFSPGEWLESLPGSARGY